MRKKINIKNNLFKEISMSELFINLKRYKIFLYILLLVTFLLPVILFLINQNKYTFQSEFVIMSDITEEGLKIAFKDPEFITLMKQNGLQDISLSVITENSSFIRCIFNAKKQKEAKKCFNLLTTFLTNKYQPLYEEKFSVSLKRFRKKDDKALFSIKTLPYYGVLLCYEKEDMKINIFPLSKMLKMIIFLFTIFLFIVFILILLTEISKSEKFNPK